MRYILILCLLLSSNTFAQSSSKINKYLKSIQQDEFTGIKKGDTWVIQPCGITWDVVDFGILIVTNSNHVGLLSEKGDWILDTIYYDIQKIYDFNHVANGLVVFNEKNEVAYFSAIGKCLIPFTIQELECRNKYILSMRGMFQALYDIQGNELVAPIEGSIDVLDGRSNTVVINYSNGKRKLLLDKEDPLPNNLAYINQEFAFCKNEVSILDYYFFLCYVKNDATILYDSNTNTVPDLVTLFPDTSQIETKTKIVWRHFLQELVDSTDDQIFLEVFKQNFLTVDFYLPSKLTSEERELGKFPVVGLSYEQAKIYAYYLTMLYQNYYSGVAEYSWIFELPSKEAWQAAALSGLDNAMARRGSMDSLNSQGCFLFNYVNLPKCKSLSGYIKTSRGGGSAPMKSFNPDGNGCFNFFGNVAEMVNEKGVAVGGSYMHTAADAHVNKTQLYDGPRPYIGLRLLAIPMIL